MLTRNENDGNSFILNFSNAERVRYGDNSYPSTIIPMEGDNGGIGNRRVFMGDDLVLGKDIPRKSLLGNNGSFNFSNPNIYRGLAPVGVGMSSLYMMSKNK